MTPEWWLVLLGVFLTAGTFVFVAAEFAFVTLDPGVIDRDPSMNDRLGRQVRRALHQLSTELSGAQLGITITTVLLGYTTQPALSSLLTDWLGSDWLGGATAAVIGAIAILAVNGFSMIFGELVPKNMAIARPLGTARGVAPWQRGFTSALRPFIVAFNNSANALLRRVGVEPREELSGGRSAQELSALVRRSAQAGTLEASTARLVTNSIEFGELTAVDVMTDRTRMTSLGREATAADVVAAARTTGHSRFPVTDGSSDDVVGIVQLRQAVSVPYERRTDVPAAALMVDAPRVPETVHLGPLLVELREAPMQMALVVDEYGGTSGVVTLEDVVEELVGEVSDEHDRRRSSGARRLPDGAWLVPGVLRPDELREITDLVVPDDGPYETLGGLVMWRLGRIPAPGDVVVERDVHLRVEIVRGRRIEQLRLWQDPAGDDE